MKPTPDSRSLPDHSYRAEDFGWSHRWVVFVCEKTGHPMKVGYTKDEYEVCPRCSGSLVPILVAPDASDDVGAGDD